MTIRRKNNMFNVDERERFKKRKSKKYKNLCSVAVTTLAIVGVATATTVRADEVTNPEATEIVTTVTEIEMTTPVEVTPVIESPAPSTNLTEAQPEPTQEATAAQEASDTQSGDIAVTNASEQLNAAVHQAEQEGVRVKEEVAKDYGVTTSAEETAAKQAEIQADYAKQTEAITKTTETYVAEKEVHATATEKVVAENNQLKAEYDARIAAYNAEVKKVNAANAAIDEAYDKARQAYEAEVANITASNNQAKEQYEAALKNYKAEVQRITQANDQKKASYEQSLSDYNNRVQQVNAENKQLEAEYQAAYKTFQDAVSQIKATNADRELAYNKALAVYQAEVERINRENEAKRQAYETAKETNLSNAAAIEAENNHIKQRNQAATDAYNKAKAIYDAEKARYDKAVAEAQTVLELGKNNPSTVDNTYKSDVWTNLKPQTLSNGIKVVADGNVTQLSDTQGENSAYKIYILDTNGVVDDSHIIKSVNIISAPVGDAVTKTGDETWELLVDKWVTLPNAILLADGTRRDLELKVSLKDAQYLYRQDIVSLSSRNGIIQIANSSGENLETAESIIRSYRVKDSTDKYLWADISLDLDGGQKHFLRSSDSVVVSVGGGVKYDGTNITTDPYLGFKFGKNPLPKPPGWGDDVIAGGLDNENSLPDGAVAVVSYTAEYIVETKNIPGYLTPGMVVGDFGISADLTSHVIGTPPKEPILKLEELKTPTSTVTIPEPTYEKLPEAPTVSYLSTPEAPTKPEAKPLPDKPEVPSYEGLPEAPTVSYKEIPAAPEKDPSVPLPEKPEEPTYKRLPDAPEAPTVSFRLATLKTQPQTEKAVETTEGVNVDKGLVAKGQEIVFDLKVDPLPANRSLTTSGVFTDPLPKGFILNLEKTVNAAAGYELSYSADNHVLSGVLTKETILALNADLTKMVSLPTFKVYGWVSNDAATYKNAWTIDFNGGEGKINGYTRTSNTVVVHTPGDPNDPDNPTNNEINPTKLSTNAAGVIIDGKPVPVGGEIFYRITLDYDQYHATTPDKETIGKGFGGFDDYPEEALAVDLGRAIIIDSDGKPVTGLLLKDNASFATSDSKVQELLTQSGIKSKISGAFVSVVAEDPFAYYENIIKAKKSVTILIPMTVKEGLYNTGTKVSNTAYQLDFGNGYVTNTVTNPTPIVTPTKVNTNSQGVVINGKPVLANSVNYYKVELDYSDYKGIEADEKLIALGFYGLDDYPEEALVLETSGFQFSASDNSLVKGLTATAYADLLEAPKALQEAMAKQGFKPKGAILVFSADDPQAYYEAYVKTGMKITATLPMTVKAELAKTGGTYENTAYQSEFGSAYVTDTIVNNVPKLDPKKDIVIDLSHDTESLAGKDIEVGTIFNYLLAGAELPAGRGSDITSYTWFDDSDEKRDQYDGVYKIFAPLAFKTKDGVAYAARTELTRYSIQTVDTATGKVFIKLDEDFLRSIDSSSAFKADLYLQMKRVGTGDVYNTYTHGVNGAEVDSNTTVSHTPVGSVLVNFLEESTGKVLQPQVTDENEVATGTSYDTSDQKVIEIVTEDGKTYELVRHKGNETGKVIKGTTVVDYLYKEVLGDVTVSYKDKGGNVIKNPVVDTPEGSTGRDYDTTDHKPEEIVTEDGKTFKLIPELTEGKETGKVVKGNTNITYVYEEVLGDVTVSYKDKDGNVIKQPEVDTPDGSTGRAYDTTDHKPEEIVTEDGKTYKLVPSLTEGEETGKVVKGNTNITYVYEEVKADVVINYVDEAGNVIQQQVKDVEQGSIGSDYDTTDNKPEFIEVDGVKYKLMPKKTLGNETGKLPREGAEVTYVYHKIVTNWVEEGTRDNLKPQEDGEKERGSFEGYEYVDKEVNEETGDITYVFKKIPKPVPVPEQPKPTPVAETSKPQPAPVVQAATLPATGEERSVGYVALGMVAMTAASGLAVTKRRKEEI
ncbi:TPA: SspB-related isopeptide-forming adhesin [Streptococcus suis]